MARRIPPSLLAKTRTLGNPADYMRGVRSPPSDTPDSILLFKRLNRLGRSHAASHGRFVLISSLHGKGSTIVDESVTPLAPGGAVLVFPYQFHHYADFARDHIVWLCVTFELADATHLMPLRNTHIELTAEAVVLLERLCDLYSSGDATRRLALTCGLLLEELLAAVPPTAARAPAAERSRDVFQRVGTFIYQHIDEPLHIRDIAEHVSLSESHLRNTFKDTFGIPLARYVRHAKLSRAAGLIATTSKTMTEIGKAVGFDSLYSFSRAFKADMGKSPMDYRRAAARRSV
jgi:AraC family transcriptional regulator of arabinose operon